MNQKEWESEVGGIIEKLYSKDTKTSDAIIDNLFTHDIKYEQMLFSVQGKDSLKKVLHLMRNTNTGNSHIQYVSIDFNKQQSLVSFHKELRLAYLPLPAISFPSFTVFTFSEINNDKFLISKMQEIVDPQAVVSSIPFIGGLYNSLFRPLTGAALVSLGTFIENPHVQKAAHDAEKLAHDGGDLLRVQRDQIYATTGRYIQTLEKTSKEMVNKVYEARQQAQDTVASAVNGTYNGNGIGNGDSNQN